MCISGKGIEQLEPIAQKGPAGILTFQFLLERIKSTL